MIEELNEKKIDATKDVAADTAIGIVGIFCEPAETALEAMKGEFDKVAENTADLTDEDSTFGKSARGGATLYSAICEYNEKLEAIDDQIEDLKDIRSAATFYTVNKYNFISEKDNYYIKVDDLGMIRLIQNWDEKGITALYAGDIGDSITNQYESICEAVAKENDPETHVLYHFFANDLYSEEEVKKACNTLIYGTNSGRDTYDSIMDIPEDLRAQCIEQINHVINEKAAGVEDTIKVHRSDYIPPQLNEEKNE